MKAKRIIISLSIVLAVFSLKLPAQNFSIGIHGTVNEYSGDLNPNQFNFYQFLFPRPGGGIFCRKD